VTIDPTTGEIYFFYGLAVKLVKLWRRIEKWVK